MAKEKSPQETAKQLGATYHVSDAKKTLPPDASPQVPRPDLSKLTDVEWLLGIAKPVLVQICRRLNADFEESKIQELPPATLYVELKGTFNGTIRFSVNPDMTFSSVGTVDGSFKRVIIYTFRDSVGPRLIKELDFETLLNLFMADIEAQLR